MTYNVHFVTETPGLKTIEGLDVQTALDLLESIKSQALPHVTEGVIVRTKIDLARQLFDESEAGKRRFLGKELYNALKVGDEIALWYVDPFDDPKHPDIVIERVTHISPEWIRLENRILYSRSWITGIEIIR